MLGRISQQWLAERVLSSSSAARRSCRSNSTSDGVSIRGVFEVAASDRVRQSKSNPKLCRHHSSSCARSQGSAVVGRPPPVGICAPWRSAPRASIGPFSATSDTRRARTLPRHCFGVCTAPHGPAVCSLFATWCPTTSAPARSIRCCSRSTCWWTLRRGDSFTLGEYTEWLGESGRTEIRPCEIGSHSPAIVPTSPERHGDCTRAPHGRAGTRRQTRAHRHAKSIRVGPATRFPFGSFGRR